MKSMSRSCGTMSAAGIIPEWKISTTVAPPYVRCDTSKYTTNNTVCNSTPYTDEDGKASGTTVFVATDCATNQRLPMALQDVRYGQPGVAITEPEGS